MTDPPPLLDLDDYAAAAERALDAGTFAYFDGGSGREATVRANREALDALALRPAVLRGLSDVSAGAELLGRQLSLPVLLAPIAFLRLAHPDGELGAADAARAAGTVLCVSPFATTPLEQIAARVGDGSWWMQTFFFEDRGVTGALADAACAAGCDALVVTVDQPGRIAPRPRERRAGFALAPDVRLPVLEPLMGARTGERPFEAFPAPDARASWEDVAELARRATVPLLVKGVLTAADARRAAQHGAAGAIVSNHGGRQLDGAIGTAQALRELRGAVPPGFALLADGAVRSGADVVKLLAAGAHATLIGRPLVWGLAAGGGDALTRMLTTLRREIEDTLAFCGCERPSAVTAALIGG